MPHTTEQLLREESHRVPGEEKPSNYSLCPTGEEELLSPGRGNGSYHTFSGLVSTRKEMSMTRNNLHQQNCSAPASHTRLPRSLRSLTGLGLLLQIHPQQALGLQDCQEQGQCSRVIPTEA